MAPKRRAARPRRALTLLSPLSLDTESPEAVPGSEAMANLDSGIAFRRRSALGLLTGKPLPPLHDHVTVQGVDLRLSHGSRDRLIRCRNATQLAPDD